MRSTSPVLLDLLIRKPRVLPLGTGLAQARAGGITGLHAQTRGKNELADSGAEAAQEGVEGLHGTSNVSDGSVRYLAVDRHDSLTSGFNLLPRVSDIRSFQPECSTRTAARRRGLGMP